MATNPEAERAKLGERLREAREYLQLSQDEVARVLGIPRAAMSQLLYGWRSESLQIAHGS
jgi:transcriptional regulator with XRE-family HTH domain